MNICAKYTIKSCLKVSEFVLCVIKGQCSDAMEKLHIVGTVAHTLWIQQICLKSGISQSSRKSFLSKSRHK